ncbi:MAG: DUF4440 domain-containing protein [Acidimicrobiaceae bacterium]|nr:DUF4440 domain-containing protein [Acidimicrobiaceae bacterium]
MTSATGIDPTELPSPIRDYLAAHAERRTGDAARLFDPDAVVVDEGRTYRGTEEVLEFLTTAGSEFTYTTTLVGCERADDDHWLVGIRLDGNFPGGTADLTYRFTLSGGHIAELVIGV